jgi:NADH:ubiquinone oxidoreductase subunit 6 (subunit J)
MSIITGLSSMLALGMLTPIQSIVCMIIVFAGTAVYLYSSGFVLMGLLYILIYVGAIAILFLFIISLLKIQYLPTPHTMSPFAITILIIAMIPLDLTYDTTYLIESVPQ